MANGGPTTTGPAIAREGRGAAGLHGGIPSEQLIPLVNLAHELRSPIGAIRTAVDVMESAGSLPGAMARARRIVAAQVEQLSDLVENLVDLAALARGSVNVREEWIDVLPQIDAAVESCSWLLADSTHSLSREMPDAPLYAYVDAMRVRQVVTNLIYNACKHTRLGGKIRLSVETVGGHLELRVEDDGEGIGSDQLPHVFDLFTRSGTLESWTPGMDIGLALVREIAELHGGSVDARSAGPGAGSTLIVRFPASRPTTPSRRP
jgi:signal transduction histidine kinase